MGRMDGAVSRRGLLRGLGALGAMAATAPAWAQGAVKLGLNGGPDERALTAAFPQKASMILQRTRPPLLETPFEVFDPVSNGGVFTPNDRFFVRWHWAVIPEQVDLATFRMAVRGHVNQAQSLTMADILALPRVELAAVNQCSGNSRGLFQPRIAGGQWQNGAMGNAKWTGVRLRDVLDRAGVRPGAVAVRFNGLDQPVVDGAPDFMKSLALDHARDGEVILAYQMNGEQLLLLNGFPLRLVVPGWYSTYWIKMVSDIEVLDAPDDSFWMKSAYLIPATPHADVQPGQTGFPTKPINRMVPRSFFTNVTPATTVKAGAPVPLRGIAFGGDCGVAAVDTSVDGGQTWQPAALGRDEGAYSFRQWTAQVGAPVSGTLTAMVRCTNTRQVPQPMEANWNGGGFMRNVIETVHLAVA
ncbi:MAG TPA: molybdopterin-dependent oxidoreductase [Acetobacteraceae bacterium]